MTSSNPMPRTFRGMGYPFLVRYAVSWARDAVQVRYDDEREVCLSPRGCPVAQDSLELLQTLTLTKKTGESTDRD